MYTTSYPTLSSSENETKQTLINFLEGKLTLSELNKALHGCIELNFDKAPAERELRNINFNENIKVVVINKHVCLMIRRYLSGAISGIDLSNWAAVIFMLPNFVPSGETEEERWASGEGPTWEIIQRLASPLIFDEINILTAERYLSKLLCDQ